MILSSSSSVSSGGANTFLWTTILIILGLPVVLTLFGLYREWRQGTFFTNFFRNLVFYGTVFLCMGVSVITFFIGKNGCRGGGADSANVGGKFPTGIYQEYQEDIDE